MFGEDEDPLISVWKCDVETHFEPLIPLACRSSLPRIPHSFSLSLVVYTTIIIPTLPYPSLLLSVYPLHTHNLKLLGSCTPRQVWFRVKPPSVGAR